MGIFLTIIAVIIIAINFDFFITLIGSILKLALFGVVALAIFNYGPSIIQNHRLEILVLAFLAAMVFIKALITPLLDEHGGYKLTYQYLLIKFRPTFTAEQLINQSLRISELKDIVNAANEKKQSIHYENIFKAISNDFIELKNRIDTLLDYYIEQNLIQINFKKPKLAEFMRYVEYNSLLSDSLALCYLEVKSKNKESILKISIGYGQSDSGYSICWKDFEDLNRINSGLNINDYGFEDFEDLDCNCLDYYDIKHTSKCVEKCLIKYIKKNPNEFV
jgi:hypothetical protein